MNKTIIAWFLIFMALGQGSVRAGNVGFVITDGMQFKLDSRPYFYVGTNFWYGINLASTGPGGDRARLDAELDNLKALGITNLRIMAGAEGPATEPWRIVPPLQISPGVYDANVLDGLDYLLKAIDDRQMRAVMCLTNFWAWSGGMAQYLNWNGAGPIPYHPPEPSGNWNTYAFYTDDFYSNAGAMQDFRDFINFIVNHVNPYTSRSCKDEPTIMAWEIANEPRGYENTDAFNAWLDDTADYIKSLDSNHLVTTGCEGNTPWPDWNGVDFVANHNGANIDYVTCHIWPQNWGWYDPADTTTFSSAQSQAVSYLQDHINIAQTTLGKPLVIEEFGLSRDSNSYDPNSTVTYRDAFYQAIFDTVYNSASSSGPAAGDNFWAWAGQGRPVIPYGSYWAPSDPWVGDPPHEHQGWYSVYDTDASTLNVIYDHAIEMYRLSPIPGDLDFDRDVDITDLAMFAEQWKKTNCGTCSGADLIENNAVDAHDLNAFAGNWLRGK